MMNSNQTARIVCVPPCLLCPSLQASKNPRKNSQRLDTWREDILNLFSELKVEIISFQCPESTFQNRNCGIGRDTHGVEFYEKLAGFTNYCQDLADKSADQIVDLIEHNCNIICICGIENSPTCAVNYIYSNKGIMKRAGIFMNYLVSAIEQKNKHIPVIGINRQHPRKALNAINAAVQE